MTTTSRRRQTVAVLVALGALTVTGCSGGDDPAPEAEPPPPTVELSEPTAAPTLQAEAVTTSGTIVGRLPRRDRSRVEGVVSDVAVRFLEAAYVAGDYPRADFRSSFPGFTAGASQAARRDLALVTNKPIGEKVEEVTPTAVGVEVDLLAAGKRAVAATAHVELAFRTAGPISKRFRVQGRLLLTKKDGAWKIFAYHLSKGSR